MFLTTWNPVLWLVDFLLTCLLLSKDLVTCFCLTFISIFPICCFFSEVTGLVISVLFVFLEGPVLISVVQSGWYLVRYNVLLYSRLELKFWTPEVAHYLSFLLIFVVSVWFWGRNWVFSSWCIVIRHSICLYFLINMFSLFNQKFDCFSLLGIYPFFMFYSVID